MEQEVKTVVRKSIPLDKIFALPSKMVNIRYANKILVVSPETANWIVLQNEEQLSFLNLLHNNQLGEALQHFSGSHQNAQAVVTQIIARKFENKKVHFKHETGTMQFYLTNGCNMRCPHCYMFAGIKKNNELSTDEVYSVLEKFYNSGGKVIVFSGGEIALRKDLLQIIEHSYNLGIKNEILTNGTLWTEETISKIAPMLSRVQISIDGYSEETNSKVRGKGNFSRALQTVESFLKYHVYTEISVTPYLDKNLEVDYPKYVEFAKNLYQKYGDINFLVKFTFDILEGRNIVVTNELKKKYQAIVTEIYDGIYGDFMDKPFMNFHKNGGLEDNCDYGNLAISADGNVVLCPILQQMKSIGNVRSDDFTSILTLAKKARELANVNNLMPCKECELKYICGGDCRVKYFDGFKECYLNMMENANRECSLGNKEYFYDMMIRLNEKMFQ